MTSSTSSSLMVNLYLNRTEFTRGQKNGSWESEISVPFAGRRNFGILRSFIIENSVVPLGRQVVINHHLGTWFDSNLDRFFGGAWTFWLPCLARYLKPGAEVFSKGTTKFTFYGTLFSCCTYLTFGESPKYAYTKHFEWFLSKNLTYTTLTCHFCIIFFIVKYTMYTR